MCFLNWHNWLYRTKRYEGETQDVYRWCISCGKIQMWDSWTVNWQNTTRNDRKESSKAFQKLKDLYWEAVEEGPIVLTVTNPKKEDKMNCMCVDRECRQDAINRGIRKADGRHRVKKNAPLVYPDRCVNEATQEFKSGGNVFQFCDRCHEYHTRMRKQLIG